MYITKKLNKDEESSFQARIGDVELKIDVAPMQKNNEGKHIGFQHTYIDFTIDEIYANTYFLKTTIHNEFGELLSKTGINNHTKVDNDIIYDGKTLKVKQYRIGFDPDKHTENEINVMVEGLANILNNYKLENGSKEQLNNQMMKKWKERHI